MKEKSFDPVWEDRYRKNPGYRNHYPWSSVVSFVYKNKPASRANGSVNLLEVGCGNGANLWFAAREGFSVSGIDASPTAIQYAKDWFSRDGLRGDLRVGDFTSLPFESGSFDLAIDRSALTFSTPANISQSIGEIWRVLRPAGRLLFNPLSDRCSSFDGLPDADGCFRKVHTGSIVPGAQVTFFSVADVRKLFQNGWAIRRMSHHEDADFNSAARTIHAEWFVEVEKTGDLV